MADVGRSDDFDGNEIAGNFRQWILSLSWPDLAEAAQIPLTGQDESLLEQMIAEHVPPETPLHPRACPVKTFVFDGRSPAKCKHHRRIHRPRLLKLLEEDPASFGEPSNQSSQSSGKNRHRRGGANNISNNHRCANTPTYTVTGENFIRSYPGETWSTPSTRKLQEADRTILNRILLVPTKSATVSQENSSNETIESVLYWTLDNTENGLVENTYHLWRVVSRGNFGKSHGKTSKICTADWLDPTERHFSLGMYLVGRVEYELYKSFFRRQETRRHGFPQILTGAYSGKAWQIAVSSVITDALRDVTNDLDLIKQKKDAKWNPRKTMLWELLDEGLVGRGQQIISSRNIHNPTFLGCSLPLLLLGSATGRLWKQLRIVDRARLFEEERLQDERRARQFEEELLQDEETVKTSTTTHTSVQESAKSSKKRKKKKKGSVRKNRHEVTGETSSPDHNRKESVPMDEFEDPSAVLAETAPTVTNNREQNRNRVLVLSIVDDILDNVYEKVGLGKQNRDEDGLVPVGTKSAVVKQTHFLKTKSIPVPSRQIAEIEKMSVQQKDTKGVKTTPTTSTPRLTHSKLAAEASRLDEIEENRKPQNFQGIASAWPDSQNHCQPYSSNIIGNLPSPDGTNTGGRSLQGPSPSDSYDAFAGTTWFKHEASGTTIWEPHNYVTLDQWRTLQGLGGRDRSIMEEFFRTQRDRELAKDESQMASSTIASIASSAEDVDVRVEGVMEVLDENPTPEDLPEDFQLGVADEDDGPTQLAVMESAGGNDDQMDLALVRESRSNDICTLESSVPAAECSPVPNRRSPTQSPILVSLEDLRGFGKEMVIVEKDRDFSFHQCGPPSIKSFSSVPIVAVGSLPNSPDEQKPRLTSSLSRENLRILSEDRETSSRTPKRFPSTVSDADNAPKSVQTRYIKMKSRDDTEIRPKGYVRKASDALDSYRNAAARSLKSRDDQDMKHTRATPQRHPSYRAVAVSYKTTSKPKVDQTRVLGPLPFDAPDGDHCVRSEIGQEDYASRRSLVVDDGDNNTVTRDGSTTITSALSQRETEETLREERDTYRDLCLTLGAEVASLKNLLAAYKGSSSYPTFGNNGEFSHASGNYQFFDPDSVSHIVQRYSRQQTMAAMSDAGYRGEHDSMASEDDLTKEKNSVAHRAQISATATVGGSDLSVEHSVRHETVPVAVPTLRHSYHQVPIGGFHSRLGRDILHFVDSINAQLQKQDTRRAKAVERTTRLVTAVWPRAQVKVYGSHVTGLCLPSSDVDFVICLPAVHKSPASVAPGALEGRNAINETSQKLLARKLKSESWIDTRSMMLIDRTVVPVIKVSTKDTKARSVHLDITFDSPNHHGVEAVDMVLE